MSTFERDPVISSLASRARDQVQAGVKELRSGNFLAAEVFFRAAIATLESLNALLDAEPVKPPLRKLCIVGTVAVPHDPELPEWFERKANDDDGGDSAA